MTGTGTITPAANREIAVLRGHAVPTGLHINGSWIARGERIAVVDPATGEVVTTVASGAVSDGFTALDAAAAVQASWAAVRPAPRATLLRRAHEIMLSRKDAFVDVMVLETGSPALRRQVSSTLRRRSCSGSRKK